MNWGEVRQAVLDKLDGPDQDLAEEYLPQMVRAANEGLALLATAGRPIRRREMVEVLKKNQPVELEMLPCYWELEGVSRCREGDLFPVGGYRREGETLWLLPGQYQITYLALEESLKQDTPTEHTFALAEEAIVLLPLYIASQIYKHDNAQLAVLWRNEFETGRELLQLSQREKRRQPGTVEFEPLPWKRGGEHFGAI